MGTRAQLGVQYPDSSISGCYIHYDGYPDHMVPALKNYVQRYTMTGLVTIIAEAQAHGGMRYFNAPPHRETAFLNDDEEYIIDERNWDNPSYYGVHYAYLVDYETGEIIQQCKV